MKLLLSWPECGTSGAILYLSGVDDLYTSSQWCRRQDNSGETEM